MKAFVIGFACLLAFIFVLASWKAPYEVPDTPAARDGFHLWTNLKPETVTNIYFFDAGTDFHGDGSMYLRFTYPAEQWVQRYLREFKVRRWRSSDSPFDSVDLSNLRNTNAAPAGCFDKRISSWWDCAQLWNLSECYTRQGANSVRPWFALWIDRSNRVVYLNEFDP